MNKRWAQLKVWEVVQWTELLESILNLMNLNLSAQTKLLKRHEWSTNVLLPVRCLNKASGLVLQVMCVKYKTQNKQTNKNKKKKNKQENNRKYPNAVSWFLYSLEDVGVIVRASVTLTLTLPPLKLNSVEGRCQSQWSPAGTQWWSASKPTTLWLQKDSEPLTQRPAFHLLLFPPQQDPRPRPRPDPPHKPVHLLHPLVCVLCLIFPLKINQ